MNTIHRAIAPLIGLLVACAAGSVAAAEFRGFVTDGPAGLLLFQACKGASIATQTIKVSDKSPDTALTAGVSAVRQVREDAARPLYVEFVGDGGANVITVRQFQRAIGHIASCAGAPKDIPAGTRLHAAGEEGGWRFVATDAGARLEFAGRKAVRFPAKSFEPGPGKTNLFDAWSAQDGGSVRIEVTEELCMEERTETATGARVVLRYASSGGEGCAARF